jgi:hypothetical protein
VSELFGHSSIETTARNTHVQAETLMRIFKTNHPKETPSMRRSGRPTGRAATALKEELLRKWQNLVTIRGANDE